MRLFVSNFPYKTSEQDLKDLFRDFGPVAEVILIYDRESGRPRGFGFVEMAEERDGQRAIDGLDGIMYDRRRLAVQAAQPKPRRLERPLAECRR